MKDLLFHLALVIALVVPAQLRAGSSKVDRSSGSGPALRSITHAREQAAEAARSLHPDPMKALELAREAKVTARILGDSTLMHDCLTIQATAQLALGLHDAHQRTVFEALEISKAMGLAHAIARDLQGLSVAYRNGGRLERSVEASRDALAMLVPTGDDEAIARAMLVHMHSLTVAGRHHDALRFGEQALDKYEALNDMEGMARTWLQIGEVHASRQNWGDALPYLVKAGRLLDTLGSDHDRIRLAMDLAKVQLGLGLVKEAAASTERASMLGQGVLLKAHGSKLRDLRYDLALAQKEWKTALALLQGIKHADDSLRTLRHDEQLAALQTMYDLEGKESDNAKLRGMIQAHATAILATQHANGLLRLAALALLFLLALAVLFGLRYRRMVRRIHLKNLVVRRQAQEIHSKNLELERQNLRLAETLLSEEEKELLLKEIHHRVKNNLQVVDSLLGLQFGHLGDSKLEEQFREARGRIRSMALVHELIYKGSDSRQQHLGAYLAQLGELVLGSHGLSERIRIEVKAVPVPLTVEQLMPIALAVNELLTNSARHAFPTGTLGIIRIEVVRDADGHLLFYRDDGRGLDKDRQLREGAFGMELLRTLARQVNGSLEQEHGPGPGVCFKFRFAPDAQALRAAS